MARAPLPLSGLIHEPAAALRSIGWRLMREWRAAPIHRLLIAGPKPEGLAVRPRDLRPADLARGEQLAAGVFRFGGEALDVGPRGDPWRRPSPSARFAGALHGFSWAGDLLSLGETGTSETLRLWVEWRRLFGAGNAFAWSGRPLERRVFHLACAAPVLAPLASEAELADLLDSLARQARHLMSEPDDPGRAAERTTAAALAGAALAGKAGEALLGRALARLERLLPAAVLRDGVHASRSPERGLELLFDLLALDDALSQLGAPAPVEVSRAIDRLSAATRFFTLADGRLAAFHGGEAGAPAMIAAALALDAEAAPPGKSAPYGGYHRLEGPGLQLMADAGAPPSGDWSGEACAQLASIAVTADGLRLVAACAWSARAAGAGALRGPAGGSCLALDGAWPGLALRPDRLSGDPAERLGGRLIEVRTERREDAGAVWLDVGHDGWRALGYVCARRLYLDPAGELRGEEVLEPIGRAARPSLDIAVRFHLAPGVAAQIAIDGRSALLRPPGRHGWRLRTDSAGLRLDPGQVFEAGEARAAQTLVLLGRTGADGAARVRWKLSRDEG